ncbi:MAG TPA: signal peptidase I [Candidatus Baltobacteraceae bacterium]|nr:signal peptidase I [Candidatus Baltobacteraceae bacterium]
MESIETHSDENIAGPVAAPPKPIAAHRAAAGALTDVLESLLVTILLALFATTFVLQAFKIPSGSMEPTLLVGDHVLVNKFIFGEHGAWYEKLLPYRSVRRGDIIVFRFPYDDHAHYVKRVIGLPGDRLRIIDQVVYIDGKPLSEPYAIHNETYDPFGETFPPLDPALLQGRLRPEWAAQIGDYIHGDSLVVPPDRYFVMGDNRDDSSDSRYWGFVDRRAIMGRPMFIYWSVRATPDDYTDRSISGTLYGIEETIAHLPSRTRWHRMLREVR